MPIYTHRGRTQTLAAWAREYNQPFNTLKSRLKSGWSFQRALLTRARKLPDLTGKRFGSLLVGERAPGRGAIKRYHCACDCGSQFVAEASQLIRGKQRCNKSKACRSKSAKRAAEKRGGTRRQARAAGLLPEYNVWIYLKVREKKGKIEVEQQWLEDFWSFVEDVGQRPDPSWVFFRFDQEGAFDIDNACWMSRSESRKLQRR